MRKQTPLLPLLLCGLGALGALAAHACTPVDGNSCVNERTCGGSTVDGSADGSTDGGVSADGAWTAEGGADGSASDGAGGDGALADSGGEGNAPPSCEGGLSYCGEDAGCIDTTMSVDHCGSCAACPNPVNSTAVACAAGSCNVTCASAYHLCNDQCLSNGDDPSVDPCLATDTLGVFVVLGGTGTGTQASPLGSIAAAMALAASASGKGRVFVCATGTFTTPLSVDSSAGGVTVYGGFTSCPTTGRWTYTPGTRTVVAPLAAGYALKMDTASASFVDVEFDAKGGVNPGDSSVAGFLTKVPSASFLRCAFNAGVGQPGVDAQPIADYAGRSTDGNPGTSVNGGGVAVVTCANGTGPTVGGAGGAPGVSGNDGTHGSPSVSPVYPANATGAPGDATKGTCPAGAFGSPGSYGPGGGPGTGAVAQGTLTAAGWSPASGVAGGNGSLGEGGGGGASLDLSGGGGGGGAGGCGGNGGGAGTGGGSSLGLLVYDSPNVTLTSCTLTAKTAGRGGGGGSGQKGQLAGNPGAGATTAECQGGAGGIGGSGGGGGGGAGGVSAAIGWKGTAAPTTISLTTSVPTAVAAGGSKGIGGLAARTAPPASNPGQDGAAGSGGVSQAVVNLP